MEIDTLEDLSITPLDPNTLLTARFLYMSILSPDWNLVSVLDADSVETYEDIDNFIPLFF